MGVKKPEFFLAHIFHTVLDTLDATDPLLTDSLNS